MPLQIAVFVVKNNSIRKVLHFILAHATDRGLAKIFYDMHQTGVINIMNDVKVLKKLTEYQNEYKISPAYTSILTMLKMHHDRDGNYYFPGAQESITKAIWCLRTYEYHNILYKRHEQPQMPLEKLVSIYYKPTVEKAKNILQLNKNNTEISFHAIGAITLLAAYHHHLDWDYKQ